MPPSEPFLAASRPEEVSLNCAGNQLLETLRRIDGIKSGKDLEEIKFKIGEYVKHLPGSYTPQKYVGLDTGTDVDVIFYGRILENVIKKFDHSWPLIGNRLDDSVKNLFVVEGSTSSLFNESLTTLSETLKEMKDEKRLRVVSTILESLIKSDALSSAVAEGCNICYKTTLAKVEVEQTWQTTVQVLVSLPERLANKLSGKMPDAFISETYANIIYLHLIKVVKFISEGYREFGVEPDVKYLSILLSKCALILNRTGLIEFARIIADWCSVDRNNVRCIVEKILNEVASQSVEPIAVTFLKQCAYGSEIRYVFGNLISNSNWKYVLTSKIPLLSYYDDVYLPINLISYLSECGTSDRLLIKLLIQLLESWSNRSVLNHITFEQHIFITKLMILSIKSIEDRLTPTERDLVLRLLFSGTQAHLELVQPKPRAIGMVTAEIFTGILNKSVVGTELKFEYEDMGEEIVEITKALRLIKKIERQNEPKESNEELSIGNLQFANLGDKSFYELGVKCKILPDLTADISQCIGKSNDVENREENSEPISEKVVEPPNLSLDEDDLDSDDDLVPYDLSNDVKISERKRPVYLRDLRDNLTDPEANKDPDIFSESLEICEEMIMSQLPSDDVSFGVELLQILVTLVEHSYVENFDNLKFKSCTAIATVFPKESAEYLCKEFHAGVGTYSVMQRLFFLDVLQESARRLSNAKLEESSTNSKTPVAISPARKKAKPISLIIETDKTRKYETLFADDFEIDETTAKKVDWEDIINKRIQSNTRRLTHETKLPKTVMNKFANVASSFFYPLLYGFGRNGAFVCGTPKIYEDQDCILLVNFLKTLSVLMVSAQNCNLAPKMGKEILDLSWTLRYHREGKVRIAVIQNIASVIVSTPMHVLTTELFEQVLEARIWLADLSQNTFRGDPDSACRSLGVSVLSLIDSVIGSNFNKP